MVQDKLKFSGLASHLVQKNLLDASAALEALEKAAQENFSFVYYLVNNNLVSSTDIFKCCEELYGLTVFDPHKKYQNLQILSSELIFRHRILPLENIDGLLHLGITDPGDQIAIETAMFYTGLRIQPILMSEEQFENFIQAGNTKSANKKLELSLLKKLDVEPAIIKENTANYEEPLIRFVDNMIQDALQKSASDIHIEPYENYCRIRYRQDGILYEAAEIPANLSARLVTRLKVMAHLDISERRLPQDGRFQISQTKIIDVRINTCPTLHGEKVVLRLLDVGHVSLDIDALGFTHMQKEIFIKKIFSPQGMVLVTGPTGSGKTVTLYSALKRLNNSEKNISTVEDPVEIQLAGINQVNINPRIGLNFSTTLKTFLRQDPDILMVGEIRDKETAEIAVQAAQTGHLVLSTVHTNSALETITRLQSMNIPAYQLVSAISLIISQRLVRKLCVNCKIPDTSCEVNSACREQGCQHCLQGYLGRTGIYEFLVISEILRELILADAPRLTIAEHLQREGFLSLREAGLSLVKKGITSVAEINRVIRDSA